MDYHESLSGCYSVSESTMSHDNGTVYCNNLHPDAHPVDLLSVEEETAVLTMVHNVHPHGEYILLSQVMYQRRWWGYWNRFEKLSSHLNNSKQEVYISVGKVHWIIQILN